MNIQGPSVQVATNIRPLTPEETGGIVEALIDGFERLKEKTEGYPRALHGIVGSFPGGERKLGGYLPAKVFRKLTAGALHQLVAVPRARFEDRWSKLPAHLPAPRAEGERRFRPGLHLKQSLHSHQGQPQLGEGA